MQLKRGQHEPNGVRTEKWVPDLPTPLSLFTDRVKESHRQSVGCPHPACAMFAKGVKGLLPPQHRPKEQIRRKSH